MKRDETKKTSWLELFYDVAYIALVAQLTYLAAEHHHSVADILNIGIIGYSIFIAWWATTANRNLQPQETTTDKLLLQLQMVGAFLMSLSMAAVFDGEYLAFFLTLAGMRFLQSFMIIRMYLLHPEARPATNNILQGFFAASALWLASAFVLDPYHYVLALAALAVDILVPLTKGEGNTRRYLNVHHLQERLGLFLMLVIGESMIVVALSNSARSILSLTEPTILFSGLGLMIALWWLYFEHIDDYRGVRPKHLFLFLHAHGILFGSIILVSVAYKLLLEGAEGVAPLSFLFIGAFGIAGALLVIRANLHQVCRRSVVLVGALALLAFVLAIGGFVQERSYESVIAVTILFIAVAIMDHFELFSAPLTPHQKRT